jgi:membrane protease YdiL (CAAX protease family)
MRLLATLAVVVAGVVPPFGGVAALLWARWSQTPLDRLGLGRPGSWLWTVIGGLALGVALELLLEGVVLLLIGASANNPAYAQLVGNTPMLIQLAVTVVIVGGIGEEIFWRGFLFERLGKLLGAGVAARIAILVVTSGFFALAHYTEQGVAGVEQAVVTGLVFGSLFARTGVLWPSMVAHSAYDLTALATIYANLEQAVAHLLFR